MQSVDSGSLMEGFRNTYVIRDIHHIIDLMIREGVIPEDSKLGVMPMMGLSKFQRTAINTPIPYLWQHQTRIKNWIEDNTPYSANNVFNALLAGAVIGASLGYTVTYSKALRNLYREVRALPSGRARTKLLRDRDECLKVISSGKQHTPMSNSPDVTDV